MFSKVGRNGGQTTWNVALDGGEQVAVMGKYFGTYTGSTVFVTVRFADGETIERRGTMGLERVLRSGSGERLFEQIVKATVTSIGGDVVGSHRTVKGAVEEYVSKVAQEIVDQRRRASQVGA